MIRIKCTLHGPLAKSLVREFDETLGELAAALEFYTRARTMGYQPEVVEGREHFQAMLPEVQR